jgi:hypothetical protein
MDDHRLTPRASILSFALTTALATAASIGLFVLLDPRAQSFWSGRFGDLVNLVRSVFVR